MRVLHLASHIYQVNSERNCRLLSTNILGPYRTLLITCTNGTMWERLVIIVHVFPHG